MERPTKKQQGTETKRKTELESLNKNILVSTMTPTIEKSPTGIPGNDIPNQDAALDHNTGSATNKAESFETMGTLGSALVHDANDNSYKYIIRPMLCIQLLVYLRAVWRYIQEPTYAFLLEGTESVLLHENHLGQVAILTKQPNLAVLTMHLLMATSWIGGTLMQKHTVSQMARFFVGEKGCDRKMYKMNRKIHSVLGIAMVLFVFAASISGGIMAYQSHGHPAMRNFLMVMAFWFAASTTMVPLMAWRKDWHQHRFWATATIVLPAIASLWTETLIYSCRRFTPLGMWKSELVGTIVGAVIGAILIVVPAWIAMKDNLAARMSPRSEYGVTSAEQQGAGIFYASVVSVFVFNLCQGFPQLRAPKWAAAGINMLLFVVAIVLVMRTTSSSAKRFVVGPSYKWFPKEIHTSIPNKEK